MKKFLWRLICLFCILGLVYIGYLEVKKQIHEKYMELRGHEGANLVAETFTESNRQLRTPNRGFYYMHGFRINDDNMDFRQNLADRFCRDEITTLSLIEVNLQYYNDKEISEQGLKNIESLFKELRKYDKTFILRFLYDWNGENKNVEPDNIAIILKHMEQVAPIINEYKDCIYVMQGLFVGNWGEMNGTKYCDVESIKALSEKMAAVTDADIYFSVRMPMFWRMATGVAEVEQEMSSQASLGKRIGLYNDGMLGSYSDYGTYGNHTRAEHGDLTYWNREEELVFQEVLCAYVPNGGEVIVDNEYNDFENAVCDLARMHVSYINRDYDRKVLQKWEAATVSEEGCFQGMDGLNYIERHLGYRFLIADNQLTYDYDRDTVSLQVTMQNVGFAPVYDSYAVQAVLYNCKTGSFRTYPMEGDLRSLSGGTKKDELLTLHTEFSMFGEKDEEYMIYFQITDPKSGKRILLANEENPKDFGYLLGQVKLEKLQKEEKASGARD